MANTPQRTLRIEDEIWDAISDLAYTEDRPMAWTIRHALVEYLERAGYDTHGMSISGHNSKQARVAEGVDRAPHRALKRKPVPA